VEPALREVIVPEEPQPANDIKPAAVVVEVKPVAAAVATKVEDQERREPEPAEAVPFYGRPPDDPGVKADKPVAKAAFKLF
jgi:HemY protein